VLIDEIWLAALLESQQISAAGAAPRRMVERASRDGCGPAVSGLRWIEACFRCSCLPWT
jgi:hypothetical protein